MAAAEVAHKRCSYRRWTIDRHSLLRSGEGRRGPLEIFGKQEGVVPQINVIAEGLSDAVMRTSGSTWLTSRASIFGCSWWNGLPGQWAMPTPSR